MVVEWLDQLILVLLQPLTARPAAAAAPPHARRLGPARPLPLLAGCLRVAAGLRRGGGGGGSIALLPLPLGTAEASPGGERCRGRGAFGGAGGGLGPGGGGGGRWGRRCVCRSVCPAGARLKRRSGAALLLFNIAASR